MHRLEQPSLITSHGDCRIWFWTTLTLQSNSLDCSGTLTVVTEKNFIPIDPDGPWGELIEIWVSVKLSPLLLHSFVTVFQRHVSWWRSLRYCWLSKQANQSKSFNKCLNYMLVLFLRLCKSFLWMLSCIRDCLRIAGGFQVGAKSRVERTNEFRTLMIIGRPF